MQEASDVEVAEAARDGERRVALLGIGQLEIGAAFVEQLPHVIEPAVWTGGGAKVDAETLEITDDVSVVEQLGAPVRLTLGEYTNLKVTTPDDMVVAGQILDQRRGKKGWRKLLFWK